jgi:hypothetical protein
MLTNLGVAIEQSCSVVRRSQKSGGITGESLCGIAHTEVTRSKHTERHPARKFRSAAGICIRARSRVRLKTVRLFDWRDALVVVLT